MTFNCIYVAVLKNLLQTQVVGVSNKFCFKPKKKHSCQLKKALQCIVQIWCPTQTNGIDYGLFAVMN